MSDSKSLAQSDVSEMKGKIMKLSHKTSISEFRSSFPAKVIALVLCLTLLDLQISGLLYSNQEITSTQTAFQATTNPLTSKQASELKDTQADSTLNHLLGTNPLSSASSEYTYEFTNEAAQIKIHLDSTETRTYEWQNNQLGHLLSIETEDETVSYQYGQSVILNDPKGLLRGVKDLGSLDSSATVLADKSASPHPPEDGFVLLAKNDNQANQIKLTTQKKNETYASEYTYEWKNETIGKLISSARIANQGKTLELTVSLHQGWNVISNPLPNPISFNQFKELITPLIILSLTDLMLNTKFIHSLPLRP